MDSRLQNLITIDDYLSATMKGFHDYLSDNTIPLEERWDSLRKYGHHLDSSNTSCHNYGPIDLCCLYDPPDRHRTYMYVDDMEHLEDVLTLNEKGESCYYTFSYCAKALESIGMVYKKGLDVNEWNAQVKEFIDELKEEILECGSSGYIYDW